MTETLAVLVYLGVGACSDAMVTMYYSCVSRGRAWAASALSALISLFNFAVLARIITSGDWRLAVAFAFGNGLGCLAIMKGRGVRGS